MLSTNCRSFIGKLRFFPIFLFLSIGLQIANQTAFASTDDVNRIEAEITKAIKQVESEAGVNRSHARRFQLLQYTVNAQMQQATWSNETFSKVLLQIAGNAGLGSYNLAHFQMDNQNYETAVRNSIKSLILRELSYRSARSTDAVNILTQTITDFISASIKVKDSVFQGNDDWSDKEANPPINIILDGIDKVSYLRYMSEMLDIAELMSFEEIRTGKTFSCALPVALPEGLRLEFDLCHTLEGSGYETVPFSKTESQRDFDFLSYRPVIAKFSTILPTLNEILYQQYFNYLVNIGETFI